jgi:hypothetical protein
MKSIRFREGKSQNFVVKRKSAGRKNYLGKKASQDFLDADGSELGVMGKNLSFWSNIFINFSNHYYDIEELFNSIGIELVGTSVLFTDEDGYISNGELIIYFSLDCDIELWQQRYDDIEGMVSDVRDFSGVKSNVSIEMDYDAPGFSLVFH